jgi:pectate lyase
MKVISLFAFAISFVPVAYAQNKMNVTLADGTVHSYSTANIKSVDFRGNAFTVNSDTVANYSGTAATINFIKSPKSGSVMIENAVGWQESAYVIWKPLDGATTYHVYLKSVGGTYQRIDQSLLRRYADYGRADALGLAAGSYIMKVVPVIDGSEDDSKSSETGELTVTHYNRQGFAHFNYTTGVGAYNDDGTLKSNAKVLYVTNDNFNTVTLDVTTNNKGTVTKGVGLGKILYLKQKGYDVTPWAIRFIGEINVKSVDSTQLLSDEKGLQLKGNKPATMMNVTMEGVGDDACWNGFGLTLYNGTGVEVRNLGVLNFKDDGIQIKGTLHAWVHNNDIFYGVPGKDADQKKGDGSLDVKDDSQYDTFSYNHFWDSGKMSLCGMKSESGPNYLCYHHNWFDHSDSRHPRVRTMTVHVWNNYYDGNAKYGVGATMGSSVFVENNYFRHVKYPMLISLQGTDASGAGTFSGENGAMIKSFGNIFAEKSNEFRFVTQNDKPTSFDAYEASTRNEQVPSTYKALVGATVYNNFDTDAALMYQYTPDATADVPAVVTGFCGAGRIGHGDLHWSFNNAADDTADAVNVALQQAVVGYTTKLLGLYGE